MIDKQLLTQSVNRAISGTDIFIVDITIGADNTITVALDSPTGVDLDKCVEITHAIEADFDRDKEDYSLEVGSAGLTAPFTVAGQWYKNIGNPVEILTTDGKKLRGTLKSYTTDPQQATITTVAKVKTPQSKRPVLQEQDITLPLTGIKEARYHIDFK